MSGEADTEAERIFNIIDADKSGEIDASELLTHLLAAGIDADEISRTFAAIDTDGDGAITRDEWRAGYARYAALNAVDTIAPQNFVAPANVLDFSEEAAADADFLLTVDHIKAWEAKHGDIQEGEWVLFRTDWDQYNTDADKFLNTDENGPHTPGPTAEAIIYLMEEKKALGWGSQCIGTDAGAAGGFEIPFPAHNLLHKNNKYGLASLTNLSELPAKGAILVTAPLKIVKGTGSPIRALAMVPAA